MAWKKKPKRRHFEPEYQLEKDFHFRILPEENPYKLSFRKRIIEGFKGSWKRFEADFKYLIKPKEKIFFLSPEMSWKEGKKALDFDLEQLEKTRKIEEEQVENFYPHLEIQQKAQEETQYKTKIPTNTSRKKTLEGKIEDEGFAKTSNTKTIEDAGGYASYKKIREPVPKHTPLWRRLIAPLSAGAILAIAIYLTPNANKITQSLQATGKIQHTQKSNSTTKTLAATFETKKAQIMQKDTITYNVKKGDTFSEIIKQYVHKSGSELYSDVKKIQKLNPSMKNPDLIKPNQKIVLEIKNKLVDKEYKVKSETNGQKIYFNTDGTKIRPDLERKIILYESKQKLKNNTPKLPKNKYKSIEKIIDNYNSTAGLFRKSKDEKDKAYIAKILDFARESGKTTIQATNAYIEHSKDSEAIKETIRRNYLYNSKSELDRILANKFEGLDTTKVKFTSIVDEKYGHGIIRKKSKTQKKQSEFMRESELLYTYLGQGKSEPIHPTNKIRRNINA